MERQTTFAKPGDVTPSWFVVDATDQVLGRLASRVAVILMGKHKPQYTPHTDVGDYIIITNAQKVKMTGNKAEHKFEKRYSRYPGGLKEVSYAELLEKHPERVIELAVRRMLPKKAMGHAMMLKMKVYAGPEHPHAAQQPQPLAL